MILFTIKNISAAKLFAIKTEQDAREGNGKKSILTVREREGNKKNTNIRKREGNAKKAFPIFGIRKGMKSRPSEL